MESCIRMIGDIELGCNVTVPVKSKQDMKTGWLIEGLLQAVLGLRERYFGPSYELLSHDKYADIWSVDEAHPCMAPEGGESVADVASRFSAVLLSAETQFHGSAILIVSHGDPLQIFQAVLSGAKENMSFLDDLTNLKVKDTDDLTNLEVKDTMVASILSQHRKFALITGELRRVV
ncbi:hypothetical protein Zm00014a_019319 [Zea mays]|uniref:Phosphoglycerate mutase family protein n=1 Tax=Zea mays TaxID=4577 RepID=A0A3L6G2A0_MAIZE|nr:hypothetical protein Zm00014a_019319 [Zea mays]